MPNEQDFVWCVRAGAHGEAHDLFEGGFIALGWIDMPDLSALAPNREAFKQKVNEVYPDKNVWAVANWAGQLYRFVHEMKVGDAVAYRPRGEQQVHLGQVTGEYRYVGGSPPFFPHRRSVQWSKEFAVANLSQGAVFEMGAIMTLFMIKNHAAEILTGKPTSTVEPLPEVTAKRVEGVTRDFILKKLARDAKGYPLQDLVAHILQTMGYRTEVSAPGPDQGVDVIAYMDPLGLQPPIIKVQVKSTEGNTGGPDVASFYGRLSPDEFGLFVTLGGFSKDAKQFAATHTNLRLVDGDQFVDLIEEHYDSFDSRYKGLLPLKRVYVPEPLEEGEG